MSYDLDTGKGPDTSNQEIIMASTIANTTLRVGLLAIPVALRGITDSKDVSFESATPEGEAVTRPSVGGTTGRVFERAELIQGVTDADGKFREIPKDAIEAAKEATQLDAFEIDSFVPLKDVPFERAIKSYFLAPQKGKGSTASAKSMALLHKALVKTKRAGVLKIVPKSRQALAVIYPVNDGLFVTTLQWSEDWQQADEANVLGEVAVEAKNLAAATALIEALSNDDVNAVLDAQKDSYRVEKERLIAEALAGKKAKPLAKKVKVEETDDLLAQLEASLLATAK